MTSSLLTGASVGMVSNYELILQEIYHKSSVLHRNADGYEEAS